MANSIGKIISLRLLSVFGVLIFSSFFAATVVTPTWIEQFASDFIESQVSKEVDSKIDKIGPVDSGGALSRAANALYESNKTEIESKKAQLRNNVHERLADAIASIRDLNCECRN